MRSENKRGSAALPAIAAVASSLALVSGCAGEPAIYEPGTYTGTGEGKGGPITVTLTVDETSIVSVDEIVGNDETPGVGGWDQIHDGSYASNIMEVQSAEIDNVTGATLTSNGVKQATQDALDQAAI